MKSKSLLALCRPSANRSFSIGLAIALASLLAPRAHAVAKTWDGGGADTNWSTAANWNADTTPALGGVDNLIFAGTTRPTNVNDLTAGSIFTGLSFPNTGNTQAFSISGASITLGGGITTTAVAAGSAITDTIALPLILNATRTVTTNTNHNVTITGAISESVLSGLNKAGAATLALQGANTFTGAVTINEGTFALSGPNGSINTASGVTISTGTFLNLNNATDNNGDRLSNTGTVVLNGATLSFLNSAIAPTNYSETTGAVTIAALANTIGSGQAAVGQTSALTLASITRTSPAVVNFSGASLGVDTRNQILVTVNPPLTNNLIGAWATLASLAFTTVAGTPATTAGPGTASTTTTTGAADWASYDAINGVTPLAAGSYTSDTWTAVDNTTVTTSSAPGSDSTTNSLRFNLTAANTVTLSGVNTINSGILVAGAVGANASTITGGTLQGSAGGELVIQQYNASGTGAVAGVAGVANAVPGSNLGFLTIASIIQDNTTATRLIKAGGGQVTLTGANTYTGVTTAMGGGLLLSGASETIKGDITLGNSCRISLGADNQIADTSVITFASGVNSCRIQLNGKSETIGGVTDAAGAFVGSRIIEAANDSIFNLPVGTLTINANANFNFGGIVRDSAGVRGPTDAISVLGITKSGTGTQDFSGAATSVAYTGPTVITGGILRLSGTNSVINNSAVTLSGGSIEFGGGTGTATRSNPILSNPNDTGRVIKSGTGTLVFTGDNTYTGNTTVNAGTLRLNGNVGTIADTGTVAVTSDTAILDVLQSDTIATLNLANSATVSGAGTLTVTTAITPNIALGKTNTISAILDGAATLTKTGQGTTILSATNTYTGTTAISAGTLLVNGDNSGATGAVNVTAAGTLGGTGTLGGALDVSTGTLAPGTPAATVGTLTAAAGASIAGTYRCDVNGATADRLAVTGTVTLSGPLTVNLLSGGFTQPSYIIAEGTSLSGTFSSITPGYVVTYTATQAILSDPYSTWAVSFGLQNPWSGVNPALNGNPTADPDADGISNLLEFVLTGSPVVSSQSINPTLAAVGSNQVLSYKRSDASEAPATIQVGQWSTDLATWTPVTPVVVSENDTAADDMTITVPNSNAVAGKLFLRLNVVK